MGKPPSFFRFFIAGEDNVNLRIPIAFNQCIDEPLPEEVLLRDRNNNTWKVKVEKRGDYWYFVDGWENFVNDNLLRLRDLLVFQYYSHNNLFNVKIYGTNATEKNVSGPAGKRSVDTFEQTSSDNEASDDDYGNDNDEENAESENDERNKVSVTNANNDGIVANNRVRMAARCLYRKCYGIEIFEAGLAEKPQNPYFVAKLNTKRASDLFIPADVIKDYNITLNPEIILVDPEEREFPSNCRIWGDGRYVVSGGWVSLCRLNYVNENTRCICEFVEKEGDQRQFLHISFVRYNV